ncbi:MAG: hypothetical protein HN742_41755 [Lentisphaerae bacterium]|jgi:Tol biopolymer transport system component|nr:hypothetical protein [Lentisphaerota bacterium]MBT4815273.1 hypothetical protein [Lentisphaerota bacterium]MBT5611699.1 hypothetical protein [Lentisphaerota bacterium]MBT7061167.1 hypothetical protein [Lentisphaerota bacterium]MBT7848464.1 hypothetical protein [Lentisphaerota bacterium]
MEDDSGVPQLWTVSPNGGTPAQVTTNPWRVQSAFSWSPDGRFLAYVMDNSVFTTDVETGESVRLTERSASWPAPTDYSCCYSPDGAWISFSRPVKNDGQIFDQIFVVAVPEGI